MKITCIVAGSGGSFYCGNCLRDTGFIEALKNDGHQVTIIPMYLPLFEKDQHKGQMAPVFFGAISLYIKQLYPLFKKMPLWVEHALNSKLLLKLAAKRAGSTNARGLEEMTLSMLRGEHGNQAEELEILINWLRHHEKPDVIHLSNALLSGLAPTLKKELKVPVICSLQDEDEWIDAMDEEYQKQTWNLIGENAPSIDAFISVSQYFKKVILQKINIPESKIFVVYHGVDVEQYTIHEEKKKDRVIGFLSRIIELNGVEILIDAFLLLKKDPAFFDVKLKFSGGYTSDEKGFINKMKKRVEQSGLKEQVEFEDHFNAEFKLQFLQSIDLLSVPIIRKESLGMHIIEAMASGIPVILPNQGAYPEIIQFTNGGILYTPNTAKELSIALVKILTDSTLFETIKNNARVGVREHFNESFQAQEVLKIYKSCINSFS